MSRIVNFNFKLLVDSSPTITKPVNIYWTMTEFINNMTPIIGEEFNTTFQIELDRIEFLDNVYNTHVSEYSRSTIEHNDHLTFSDMYNLDSHENLNNLAFYVRPHTHEITPDNNIIPIN
jgi:hypothetical protein